MITRKYRRVRARRIPASGPDGFTLVELMVAVIVLVIGVLAMASTSGAVARLIGGGAQQALAANVAQSRFERMRTTPCASMSASGSASARGVTEQWTATQVVPTLYDVTVNITYSTPGGARQPQAYRSYVQCR